MGLKIPKVYYKNLSSYEEFVLKTSLLGKNIWDKDVLRCLNKFEDYYWFVADGHLCFIDGRGNECKECVIEADFDCSCHNELTSLDGLPKVTGIVCEDCKSLKTVVVPDSVTRIGYQAFAMCTSLTSISIPDLVTYIGTMHSIIAALYSQSSSAKTH